MLEANPTPHVAHLLEDYRAGKFEIELLEESEFDRRIKECGKVIDCPDAYFIQKAPPEKSVILLRKFKIGDLKDMTERMEAFQNLLRLLPSLIHEWEHLRHFTGPNHYNASLDRANRMGSEMLSFLEQYSWIILHDNDRTLRGMNYLGDSLITYFRSMADATYYTRTNERLAREVIP